jgi:hypothetical protein
MPTPETGFDLSPRMCVDRVEAIPDDHYALFVYYTSRMEQYRVLAQGKAITMADMVERARAADDTTFVETTDCEAQAEIWIRDAIEMTMIVFKTYAANFVDSHTRLLKILETTPRMKVVGSTKLRFFKGHTQIRECVVSQKNMDLYVAYHRMHHHEDIEIDDGVAEFTLNNELMRHYQGTRNKAYFMAMGTKLKEALKTILLWTEENAK